MEEKTPPKKDKEEIKLCDNPMVRAQQDSYILQMIRAKIVDNPPTARDLGGAGVRMPRRDCPLCYGRKYVGFTDAFIQDSGKFVKQPVLCQCIVKAVMSRYPIDIFYYMEKNKKENEDAKGLPTSGGGSAQTKEETGGGENPKEDSDKRDQHGGKDQGGQGNSEGVGGLQGEPKDEGANPLDSGKNPPGSS